MKLNRLFFIFAISSLFFVVATLVDAASCCLNSGTEFCISSEDDSVPGCETTLPGSCEEHSECSTRGACIFTEENVCQDSFSEVGCQGEGREFQAGLLCEDIGNFIDVCCEFSSESSSGFEFVTENECNSRQGQIHYDVSEAQCVQMASTSVMACCVKSDGSCSFGLESGCIDGIPQQFFCSQLTTQCNPVCKPSSFRAPGKVELGMSEYDLYSYDGCGNPDSLVPIVDCNDFSEMPALENGLWVCSDARCYDVWDNPYTDENLDNNLLGDTEFQFGGELGLTGPRRNFRFNGESWCEYQQAKVGPALDLPGTRHYLHYCDNGKEVLDDTVGDDTVGDDAGRSKICVQEIVDGPLGYGMIKARWIDNDPEKCFICNSASDPAACCSSRSAQNVGCSYIPRKDLTDDNTLDIVIVGYIYDVFDGIRDGTIEGYGSTLDYIVRSSRLEYYQDGDIVHTSSNMRHFDVIIDSNLGDQPCDGGCTLTLTELPPDPGTYNLKVYIDGYFCIPNPFYWGDCWESDNNVRMDLGTYTFNPQNGVCIPLVPPSGSDYCSMFNEITPAVDEEGNVNSAFEFNYYYDFPYNSFGESSCGNTNDCRDLFLSTYSAQKTPLLIISDMNNLCRSLGDCGAASNLAGEVSVSGYITSSVQTFLGGGGLDVERTQQRQQNDLANNLDGSLANLRDGEPTRVEDYFLILIFPNVFLRRKFNGKFLMYFLFIILLFLSACAGSDPFDLTLPPPATISCNAWQSPVGTENCWKCSAKQIDGGFLPDKLILTTDEKSAYRCTESLCLSLGACDFSPGLENEEPGCVPQSEITTVPRIQFTDVNYVCSTFENTACTHAISTDGKHVSISGKLESLETINFNFRTLDLNDPNNEVLTVCGFDDNANMDSPFNLPSPDGGRLLSEHVLRITNPTSMDENYKYYIRCATSTGEVSAAPFSTVEFNVGREGYTTPFITGVDPAEGSAYVRNGISARPVTLFVQGDVKQCKWDTRRVEYSEMSTVSVSKTIREVAPNGTTFEVVLEDTEVDNIFICDSGSYQENVFRDSHMCSTVLDGVVQGENNYWFSCIGLEGEATNPWPENDNGYIMIGTEPLEITDIKCMHSLGENCDEIYDRSFDFSIRTGGGAREGEAACRWSLNEYDFDVFDEPGGNVLTPEFGITHAERNFTFGAGEARLKFTCEDIAENVAEEEITVNIQSDQTPPRITKIYRYSNELNVQTDEITTCYYVTSTTASFENALEFSTSNGLEHTVSLDYGSTGVYKNFYRVRCIDNFNNFRQTDVYIT